MSEFSGAFLGFWFNGKHSSDFGIVRTIENRMDLNLRPESKDIAIEVPGMDGSYYYGTNYTKRNFNIKFAFDAMTEEDLQGMKAWLMDKKIHELIFDEAPYKEYSAKATGVSNISHLCFEENGQRVYRGEGTISFVCNYPFARGLYRSL
jgi:predicted phage tail component-like protein